MNIYISTIFLLLTVRNAFLNPSCPELQPDMINIHLVCHTHDDVGWLKTVDQYYYGSRKNIVNIGVQYIIDSVVATLLRDPKKKFIYVESAFFFRWWNEQDDLMKNDVRTLVNNGQLEFINGGWSMNDEASTHYNAIIDQMTLGLAKLNETFGPAAFPRIGWQVDPFGHSAEQASLFAQMGMDALFFGRLDYDDKRNRENLKEMEMVWKPSNNLAEDAWIFTGALPNMYTNPSGFCFDIRCEDNPIMDNPNLEGYNKDRKVDEFLVEAHLQATNYKSAKNLIMTFGGDFQYVNAMSVYKNLDKLIKYVNERQVNGSNINLVYSTPSCYLDALHDENLSWPTKTDDFFPYASDRHTYWTGYFTSRPTLKGYVRQSNNLLQSIKQIAALTGVERGPSFTKLAEAMGVLQHHDGVSGTAKQHVTDNYVKRLSDGAAAAEDLISTGFSTLTNQAQTESFTTCSLLNISSCAYTEENLSFVVNVYNPIGRTRSHYVRVPVPDAFDYSVMDQQGNLLEAQIVPIPAPVLNLPSRNSLAQFDLIFFAENLPALGVSQFLVETSGTPLPVHHLNYSKRKVDNADTIINNGKLQLRFDASTNKLRNIGLVTQDGLQDMNVTQDWMWYAGMKGNNGVAETRASGAYIFRPDGDIKELTNVTTITGDYDGLHVHEVHQEFSPWVSQVVRTFTDKSYVEVEWLVGPIPIDDNIGKEIVTIYDWSDMTTDQTFYTDANGREMQKRVVDYRETWNLSLATEPVSRNYYPVTARFILQSTNAQGNAALLNDRAQGGTSLSDGQIEIMVHRRLLYDDDKGVAEALNEMAFGEGLVVRGRHILIHSNLATPECDFGCQHRTVGEELLLQPLLTFSSLSTFNTSGSGQISGLVPSLPPNIRLLTLEPWTTVGTWLLRLENFYEENESTLSGTVEVDIEGLFTGWTISDVQELTLGANAYKGDINRLQWNTVDGSGRKASGVPESRVALFSFSPMQIRTFIVNVVPK